MYNQMKLILIQFSLRSSFSEIFFHCVSTHSWCVSSLKNSMDVGVEKDCTFEMTSCINYEDASRSHTAREEMQSLSAFAAQIYERRNCIGTGYFICEQRSELQCLRADFLIVGITNWSTNFNYYKKFVMKIDLLCVIWIPESSLVRQQFDCLTSWRVNISLLNVLLNLRATTAGTKTYANIVASKS